MIHNTVPVYTTCIRNMKSSQWALSKRIWYDIDSIIRMWNTMRDFNWFSPVRTLMRYWCFRYLLYNVAIITALVPWDSFTGGSGAVSECSYICLYKNHIHIQSLMTFIMQARNIHMIDAWMVRSWKMPQRI